jgi:YggT family protein
MFLPKIIENFILIYTALIFIRCLLTWFMSANWAYQAIAFLSPITDPYLNLFRSLIPPLGGMDFSPWIAIIVLQVVGNLIIKAAYTLA